MYLYKGKSHPKLSDDTYRNLVKERTWAEHLTSLPKQGVGALLSVSAFNHERAPMSCLHMPSKQKIGQTIAYN